MSAGKEGDKCTKSCKDHNTSTSSSSSYPENWQYQQFKSQETEFILLGKGSQRDKLYKYKSKFKTSIDNILDLDTSENYLTLEGSEALLQENKIFLDEIKGVTEYLTLSCTRVLDFVDRIKKHSEEVLRNQNIIPKL